MSRRHNRRYGHRARGSVGVVVVNEQAFGFTPGLESIVTTNLTQPAFVEVQEEAAVEPQPQPDPVTAPEFVEVQEGGGDAIFSGTTLVTAPEFVEVQEGGGYDIPPVTTSSGDGRGSYYSTIDSSSSCGPGGGFDTTTFSQTFSQTLLDQANEQAYSAPHALPSVPESPPTGPTTWVSDPAYWTCRFCGGGYGYVSSPPRQGPHRTVHCGGCGHLADATPTYGTNDEGVFVARVNVGDFPAESVSTDTNGNPVFVSAFPEDANTIKTIKLGGQVVLNPPVPIVPGAWKFDAAPRTYTNAFGERVTTTAIYTVQSGNTVQGIARTYLGDPNWVPPGSGIRNGGVNHINQANSATSGYNADSIVPGQALYMPPEAAANAKKLIAALAAGTITSGSTITDLPTSSGGGSSDGGGGGSGRTRKTSALLPMVGLGLGVAAVAVMANWDKIKKKF